VYVYAVLLSCLLSVLSLYLSQLYPPIFKQYMPSSVRLSVCDVRAPYSGEWNFRQCFYAVWNISHLRPFDQKFTEIVPGKPPPSGLNRREVAKCSDLGPLRGYISETMQDRR